MATKSIDKAERREAARKQAEVLRNQAKARERKQRLIMVVVATVVLGLVAWGGFIIYQASQTTLLTEFEGERPAGSDDHGGIPIGAEGAGSPNTGAADVQVYLDFACPACQQFEAVNGQDIQALVQDGTITAVYHPLNFLDGQSDGYSTRAADAFATVAHHAPEQAIEFAESMFTLEVGASNEEIAALAAQVGVPEDAVAQIGAGAYAPWVDVASQQARRDAVGATPTIIIDGTELDPEEPGQNWSVPGELDAFIRESVG